MLWQLNLSGLWLHLPYPDWNTHKPLFCLSLAFVALTLTAPTTSSEFSSGTTQTHLCGHSSNRQTWGASCVVSYQGQQTRSSLEHSPWHLGVLCGRESPSGRSEPGGLGSEDTPGFPGTSGCGWCAGCYECDCQIQTVKRQKKKKNRH